MFGSLGVRNYRIYFFGQSISLAGTWMQNVGIGWLVLELTHSGTVLGIVTAARYAPLLLIGPWGGLAADRLDNRRLLNVTQSCAAVISLILALVSVMSSISVTVVLVLVILLGLVNVFDGPARQNLISQLVPRPLLGNAIALNSISLNLSRAVGPGIAGVLIATVGIAPCFFFNALSFVAVVVSLLLMRSSEIAPAEREEKSKGQIVAGWTYAVAKPELRYPLILVIVTGILAWEFPVTLPLLTTGTFHGGATAYGIAMSCLSVGSICGGLVAARRRSVTVRSLAISAVLWGVLICAASASPNLPLELVTLAFVGSGAVTFNSMAKTLLQLESAPSMRGRIMSTWSIFWQGSTMIGAPLVGAVGTSLGPRYGLLIGGIGTCLVGATVIARRPAGSPMITAKLLD